MRPGGVDDGENKPQIIEGLLGMPLHGEGEVVAGQFDRLDHAVAVPRADHQTVAEFAG